MTDASIKWLQIHSPGDFNRIRRWIEENKALGIEGFEQIADKNDNLCFMLGYQDERGQSHFVAGVRTQIWEFKEKIEHRVRAALHMER